MKTYEETVKSVFERSEKIIKKKAIRRRYISVVATLLASSLILVALSASAIMTYMNREPGDFGFGHGGLVGSPDDSLAITSSKETSASVSEQPRGGEPNAAISIRGLEQLEEMRKMAEHQDVEELNLYLESIEGGGAKSREDLIDFLTLVDSLPTIKFIDGTISWISHQTGNSTDTGAYYDVVFVSTEAKNGNWTRIEYLLSVDDVSTEVDKRNDEGEFADSILENPIKSKNEKITVYSETREKHTSDKGEVIKWVLDVDGIFAQVVYYTNDANSVVTKNVFDSVSILNISEK